MTSCRWERAIKELQCAQQAFDNAEPEFVESAIYKLKAAEARADAVRKEVIGK